MPLLQSPFLRRLLLLFLPAAMLVIAAAWLVYQAESARIQGEWAIKGKQVVTIGATSAERTLDLVGRDLLYLARSHALNAVLNQGSPRDAEQLSADWVAFSRAKRNYDQIRWLDESGMERIRVDFRPGAPVIIPPYGLQNKAKRYFFSDAFKLNPGEIFVSPLDLNIEGNQVEVPWKPMIRIGTPVFDQHNVKRGIVLLNYFGNDLLERLRVMSDKQLWLTNAEGYWLMGPDRESEWGFMFQKPELSLAQRYPEVWQQMSGSESGQFETAAGLWSYATVRPLQQGQRTSGGSHEAFAASLSTLDSAAYVWKMVHLIPRSEFSAQFGQLQQRLTSISLLVLLVLFAAIWRLARAQEAEASALLAVSQANRELEQRVEERTRELEEEVEERRAAEQSSREAASQYQGILEATSDGFWLTDRAGTILDTNNAYCALLGCTRQEVVGHKIADFEIRQSAAEIDRNIERIEHLGHTRFETSHRCHDGRPLDLEVSVSAIPHTDHLVAFLRDITERKQTEDWLRQMARVVDATDNAVMLTEPDGRITYVNAAFSAITGYSDSETLGKTPGLLHSGRHEPAFYAEMWRQLKAFGVWQGEIWNRRKNGELYPEWLTISDVRTPAGVLTHYAAVFSDITRIKQSAQRMEFLAHHDGLTGLPNRLLLMARLEHALQRALRESRQLALMFIDLDHFKSVNDQLGHAAGDHLLQNVATRMKSVCRADDTLARMGGDEFVLLLEGIDSDDDVNRVGQALLAQYPIRCAIPDGEIVVTASIGVAYFPRDGADAETLLRSADAAMYVAKSKGRNRMSSSSPVA
jgi:diguanylate cyclase (GGDEF)-like protein/PAS domain S-box-containing protein